MPIAGPGTVPARYEDASKDKPSSMIRTRPVVRVWAPDRYKTPKRRLSNKVQGLPWRNTVSKLTGD